MKEDCGSNGGDDGRVIASDFARTLAWNKKDQGEEKEEADHHDATYRMADAPTTRIIEQTHLA